MGTVREMMRGTIPSCPGSGGWRWIKCSRFIIPAASGGTRLRKGFPRPEPGCEARIVKWSGDPRSRKLEDPCLSADIGAPKLVDSTPHSRSSRRACEKISEAIARGDVLQVNLSRREDAAFEGDAWALYEDLVAAHPAPFAAYLEGPGFAIASCSPERFLKLRGDLVEARPIKGTVARGGDAAADDAQRQWLALSTKDRAENVMIVDLMRNDLGRVAALGSVRVPELFALEPYAASGRWSPQCRRSCVPAAASISCCGHAGRRVR